MAIALSVIAVMNGCSQVQGTFLGYGERCGNANLSAIIPNLELKCGFELSDSISGSDINFYLNNANDKLSDFDKIVQVCDTDGCFIKEEYIEEDKDINHIIYEEEKIIVKRLSSILKIRNYKKDNINEVLKEDKIKLYYNSTNIDHVFDNIQNPSDKEKKHLSIKMDLKYKNSLDFLNNKKILQLYII